MANGIGWNKKTNIFNKKKKTNMHYKFNQIIILTAILIIKPQWLENYTKMYYFFYRRH